METKKCKICNTDKPLSEMVKHQLTSDGYLYQCKQCAKERKLKIRYKVTVEYKQCHKCGETKIFGDFPKNARMLDGLNHLCKACSNTIRKNKGYWKKANNIRNQKCKENLDFYLHVMEVTDNYRWNNPRSKMFSNAKKRAKDKGLEFNLKVSDIVIPELCPILKVPFITGKYLDYEFTPSLDRIDNNKGYIIGNIQVITKKANSMKNSASPEELLRFADWVYQNFKRHSPNLQE